VLSKIALKQMKEGNSDASFPKVSKKIVNLKKKKPIVLTHQTLGLQLKKRKDTLKLWLKEYSTQ